MTWPPSGRQACASSSSSSIVVVVVVAAVVLSLTLTLTPTLTPTLTLALSLTLALTEAGVQLDEIEATEATDPEEIERQALQALGAVEMLSAHQARRRPGLQPDAPRPATRCAPACNPMWSGLQPYVSVRPTRRSSQGSSPSGGVLSCC